MAVYTTTFKYTSDIAGYESGQETFTYDTSTGTSTHKDMILAFIDSTLAGKSHLLTVELSGDWYGNFSSIFQNFSNLKSCKMNFNSVQPTRSSFDYAFYNCNKLEQFEFTSAYLVQSPTFNSMFYNCSSLLSVDLSSLKGDRGSSSATIINCMSMFAECRKLTYVKMCSFYGVRFNFAETFINCFALTTVDLHINMNYALSLYINIRKMFSGCGSIEDVTLDFTQLDTSQYIYYEYPQDVFSGCTKLRSVTFTQTDRSYISTSSTRTLDYFFYNCQALTEFTLPRMFLRSATGLYRTFNYCKSLTNIDTSDWDLSNVKDMTSTFDNCTSLTSLDLSNQDLRSVTTFERTFSSCTNLTEVRFNPNYNLTKPTTLSGMFSGCTSLQRMDLSAFTLENVTVISNIFNNCSNLINVQFDYDKLNTGKLTSINSAFQNTAINGSSDPLFNYSRFDVSYVKNMNSLFSGTGCNNFEGIENWNTGSLTTMSYIFSSSKITRMEHMKNWNLSNVTGLLGLFSGCRLLEYADISGWNAPLANNFASLFENCVSLVRVNMTNFSAETLQNGRDVFTGATALEEIIGLETVYLPNLRYASKMFYQCKNIKNIDISNFQCNSIQEMTDMFRECSKLEVINLANINSSTITNMNNAFYMDVELTKIYASPGFDASNVASGNIFWSNSKLVGGNGTVFSMSEDIGKKYLQIDSWDRKGYLSSITPITYLDDVSITKVYTNGMSYVSRPTELVLGNAESKFNLYGIQQLVDGEWVTIQEKHSNETLTVTTTSVYMRTNRVNVSDSSPILERYFEGFTNDLKYNYYFPVGTTATLRFIARVQTDSEFIDYISTPFDFISIKTVTPKYSFANGVSGFKNGKSVSTHPSLVVTLPDSADFDLNGFAYSYKGDDASDNNRHLYTNVTQQNNVYTLKPSLDDAWFTLQDFDKNLSQDAQYSSFILYGESYYGPGVVDAITFNSSTTFVATQNITLDLDFNTSTGEIGGSASVQRSFSYSVNIPAVLEFSKDPDFNVLSRRIPLTGTQTGGTTTYSIPNIQLGSGDTGLNYIRLKALYSESDKLYGYQDRVSDTEIIDYTLHVPEISSFSVIVNDKGELVANVVEDVGSPKSTITLEVYKELSEDPIYEFELTSNEDTILTIGEPGTSWYFKAKATNSMGVFYAQELDSEGELVDKVIYKALPLVVTPNYEEVAQPNLTAQKVQLDGSVIIQFNWNEIDTNAYKVQYNVYPVSDKSISPSMFEDIENGFSYKFDEREDGEKVKFIFECLIKDSLGNTIRSYQIESDEIELDVVDLDDPSLTYRLEKTYHSITYILSTLNKNNYKLAYEMISISKDGELIQKYENGDENPTSSSPDLEGMIEAVFENLDASDSYDIIYKYIFVNPLDYAKQKVLEDTFKYLTSELLLYPVKQLDVDISNKISNKPSTKSNYHITWNAPDAGSEIVQRYILRYRINEGEIMMKYTTLTSIDLLASELNINNEDVLQLSIGAEYTLYEGEQEIIWNDLPNIVIAVTDYVYYRSTYPNIETMFRTMYKDEKLIREFYTS